MDKYQILSELGTGSQGTIFIASDKRKRELVIMKVFTNEQSFSDEKLPGEREVYINKVLKDKRLRIQPLYLNSFYDDNKCVLITEYLRKYQPMCDFWDRSGRLKLDQIAGMATNLLNSLIAMHNAGIYHRDIKPDNILVDVGKLKCKFIDFGLSCYINAGVDNSLNDVPGTRTYTDPMLVYKWYNKRDIYEEDYKRGDYYSLLSVIYELVVGKTPNDHFFSEEHETKQTLYEMMTGKIAPISVFFNPRWILFTREYPQFDKLIKEYFTHSVFYSKRRGSW